MEPPHASSLTQHLQDMNDANRAKLPDAAATVVNTLRSL